MDDPRAQYESLPTRDLLIIFMQPLTPETRQLLTEILNARGLTWEEIGAQMKQISAEISGEEPDRAGPLAPRWARLLAFAIDFVGIDLIAYFLLLPLRDRSESLSGSILVLVVLAYMSLRDAAPGFSVGKRLLKIRVVQFRSGAPCTWWQSATRNLTLVLQLLDWIWILGRGRMRLGDLFAGTVVVKDSARQPRPD